MADKDASDLIMATGKLGGALDDVAKKADEATKNVRSLIKEIKKLEDAVEKLGGTKFGGFDAVSGGGGANGGGPTIPSGIGADAPRGNGGDFNMPQPNMLITPNGGGASFSSSMRPPTQTGGGGGNRLFAASPDGTISPSSTALATIPKFSSAIAVPPAKDPSEIVKATALNPMDTSYGEPPKGPMFTSADVGGIARIAKGAATAAFSLLPDAEEGIRRVSMSETISLMGTGSTESRFTRRAVGQILESQNAITGINSDMEMQAVLASNNRAANISEVTQVAQTAAWAQRYGYANAEAAEMSMGQYTAQQSNALLNYTGIATMNADGSDRSLTDISQDLYQQYITGNESFQGEKGAQNLEFYLRETGALDSLSGEAKPLVQKMLMEQRAAEEMGIEWSPDNNSEFADASGKNSTVLESQGEALSSENSRTEAGATDAAAGYKTANEMLAKFSQALEVAYEALGPFGQMLQRLNGGGVAVNSSPVGQAGLSFLGGIGNIVGGAMSVGGSILTGMALRGMGGKLFGGKMPGPFGGKGGGTVPGPTGGKPGGGTPGGKPGGGGWGKKLSGVGKGLRKIPGIGKVLGVGIGALGVGLMMRPAGTEDLDLEAMSAEELEVHGLTEEDVQEILLAEEEALAAEGVEGEPAEDGQGWGAGETVTLGVAAGVAAGSAKGVRDFRNRGPRTWVDKDGHKVIEGKTADRSSESSTPHKPPSGRKALGGGKAAKKAGVWGATKVVGKTLMRKVPVIGWALSAAEVGYAGIKEEGNLVDKWAAMSQTAQDMFDPTKIASDIFGEGSLVHKAAEANPLMLPINMANKAATAARSWITDKFGSKDKPLEEKDVEGDEEGAKDPEEEPKVDRSRKEDKGTVSLLEGMNDALIQVTENLLKFGGAVTDKTEEGAPSARKKIEDRLRAGSKAFQGEGGDERLQFYMDQTGMRSMADEADAKQEVEGPPPEKKIDLGEANTLSILHGAKGITKEEVDEGWGIRPLKGHDPKEYDPKDMRNLDIRGLGRGASEDGYALAMKGFMRGKEAMFDLEDAGKIGIALPMRKDGDKSIVDKIKGLIGTSPVDMVKNLGKTLGEKIGSLGYKSSPAPLGSKTNPHQFSLAEGAKSPLGALWEGPLAAARSVLSNPLASGSDPDSPTSEPGEGVPYDPSGGAEQYRPIVEKVVEELGIDSRYIDGILGQINQESSGNPNAVNDNDSNWEKGTASWGIMQTIAPTFASWAKEGTDLTIKYRDVAGKQQQIIEAQLDPYNSIYAGLNYAKNKYGNSRFDEWAQGIHRAYSQGAVRIPNDQLAYLHANEMILPADTAESFRKVLAESRSGYGNGVGTVNINVTLNNASDDEARRLIDTVTDVMEDYYDVRSVTRS